MAPLDHITAAVNAVLKTGSDEAWKVVWSRMSAQEKLRFDLFLVRMNDELAWQAGPPEDRFRTRVLRMAALGRERRDAKA